VELFWYLPQERKKILLENRCQERRGDMAQKKGKKKAKKAAGPVVTGGKKGKKKK
jgi:hypothetical protein